MPSNIDDDDLADEGRRNIVGADGEDGEAQSVGTPEATNNNSSQQGTMACPQEVGTSARYDNEAVDGDAGTQAGEGSLKDDDEQKSPPPIRNETSEEHTEQRRPEVHVSRMHAPPADAHVGAMPCGSLYSGSTVSSHMYATNIDHYDIAGAGASAIGGTSTSTSISSGSSWLSRHLADMNTEATPPGTRTRSTARPICDSIRNSSSGIDAISSKTRGPRNTSGDSNYYSTNRSRKDYSAKAKEDEKLHAERAHTATDEQCTPRSDDSSSKGAVASMRGDASTILSSSSIISATSATGSASEGSSTAISSLTSPTFHSMNVDDGLTLRSRSRSRSRSRDMLPTIPSDSDDDDVDVDGTSRGGTSIIDERTAAAIRRSMHETPGAYRVTSIYAGEDAADSSIVEDSMATGTSTSTVTFSSSNSNSNGDDVRSRREQGLRSGSNPRGRTSSRRTPSSSRATLSTNSSWDDVSIELAEAWVVEEDGGGAGPSAGAAPSAQPTGLTSDSSSASPGIDASVEPAVVTVTATPVKERRWFKTPSGIILLILLLGGLVALAVGVAIPVRKKGSNEAAASRPFDIVIPSMPQDVSDMLEFKYNKVVEGQPIPMAFSADLSLHASSRIDEWYGQLQVVQYDANSTSWNVVSKYDAEEARKDEFKTDIQHGNSPGDNFGAWVDMSYDGRTLAVGLPRDDPFNIPDAGSVRVMKMSMSLEESDLNDGAQHRWNLKGHGDFIVGVDPFSWTGLTFSLTADGSMIAVASPVGSKSRGNIIAYKFEPDDAISDGGSWIKIGQTITGNEFGSALSFAKLSEDGSILGAGSFLNGDDQSGQLRIFRWDDAANLWVQIGSTFEGNAKARLGVFPHFSRDGRTVAFSQTGDPHKCHVYQWQEDKSEWIRIDDEQVFPDSYICMDLSPDGRKVILCSTEEERCILNLLHSGGEWHEVQVFPKVDGFMPYHFEREGEGDRLAGIVAPIGNEKGYTIGFYNIT